MSISLSFRTDESVRDELDKIAEDLDRNRNWVINEAISNYLALYRWQVKHIEEGIRDSDAGRTYSPEEVRAHFAKRHAEVRKAAKR
jgi:predicted transcriptional regulator